MNRQLQPHCTQVPPFCTAIHADVRTFAWRTLYQQSTFDVVMMDPPWQLATANPTRGVALEYSQLTDRDIAALPIPRLQTNGLLFVWVINAKYATCVDFLDKWGYRCAATKLYRNELQFVYACGCRAVFHGCATCAGGRVVKRASL